MAPNDTDPASPSICAEGFATIPDDTRAHLEDVPCHGTAELDDHLLQGLRRQRPPPKLSPRIVSSSDGETAAAYYVGPQSLPTRADTPPLEPAVEVAVTPTAPVTQPALAPLAPTAGGVPAAEPNVPERPVQVEPVRTSPSRIAIGAVAIASAALAVIGFAWPRTRAPAEHVEDSPVASAMRSPAPTATLVSSPDLLPSVSASDNPPALPSGRARTAPSSGSHPAGSKANAPHSTATFPDPPPRPATPDAARLEPSPAHAPSAKPLDDSARTL